VLIDKNGKIGGRVSIIDIFVIIVLVIAVIGIAFRFVSAPSKSARDRVKLSYVVEIDGIREYTVNALNKQGTVIDAKQKCLIGKITDVSSKPQILEQFDSSGNLVYAQVPNKYTAEITILSEGKESQSGYFVGNDTVLSVGSDISIATKYVNSSGKVKKIEKID
jgi:hypothetical protein